MCSISSCCVMHAERQHPAVVLLLLLAALMPLVGAGTAAQSGVSVRLVRSI